ncbi:unnamed protein product [Lactuca virosa]|uniref:Mannosyltransferase n=1 Tax=Lactuca virosa TaxID=75947 RepID=A0AAU9PRU2_9ASTR|nr:unnamed protein product [Lactuca virosa]
MEKICVAVRVRPPVKSDEDSNSNSNGSHWKVDDNRISLYRSLSGTPLPLLFLILLTISVVVDYYYYGKWTSSVMNLLVYNVLGGGESHLYGTEGPLFYLKNGFNNFNFALVFALMFVVLFPFTKKKYAPDIDLIQGF